MDRGVSERTVWRWIAVARRTGEPLPSVGRTCPVCGEPLPERATIRRVYCGGRCRVRAYRGRQLSNRTHDE